MSSDAGRSHDIMELHRQMEREPRPEVRANLARTIQLIKGESGDVRSMRESLIRAHRNEDHEEIRDIHDYISNKQKYRNE